MIKDEALNLNCKSVQKRLATQWGYVEQKEWQRLSDDEIDSLDRWGDLMSPQDMIDFARAIEQALKEKNHA